ncbi:MAG: BON domain-containing protein [Acidobacteria bacterium]|nr:BON domain-containing protein [Acidobacteriota bacterium]MCI0723112.1 BON domain-containing protein [Acidobacteriota bacterium]
MNASDYQRGRGVIGTLVSVVVIFLLAIGVWYYWQQRNGSVKAAWYSIKETSEDAATTTKVKTALMLSKHASAFDINVDTKQRVVSLRGQVPSEEIKAMAGAIAQDTSGVKELHNNLVIDPATRPNPEASRLGERVADLEIKTIVQDVIRKSPELKDKQIELAVQERKVTLNGVVETESQKNLAQQIAWGAQGVTGVTNNISVTTPQSGDTPEDKLAKRVEFELYSTKAFSLNTLQIHSKDGTVTLGGTVSSRAEKLLAEKVAQTVSGVRRVVNNLSVIGEGDREV